MSPPGSLPRILVAASATLPRTENTGVGDSESNRFDTLVLNVGLLTTLGSSPGSDKVKAYDFTKA